MSPAKKISLQRIINSSFGVGAALLVGQLMPKVLGYQIAKYAAWRNSRARGVSSRFRKGIACAIS